MPSLKIPEVSKVGGARAKTAILWYPVYNLQEKVLMQTTSEYWNFWHVTYVHANNKNIQPKKCEHVYTELQFI